MTVLLWAGFTAENAMALDDAERAKLDDFQFMHGDAAGPLALALDQLTDAMAMVAQHKVYCRLEKGPRPGEPMLDVIEATRLMENAKRLVQESFQKLKSV